MKRKIVAALICALLLISTLSFAANAADTYVPNGTAVSSAEEFMKMDSSGTYYLAADITLSETYAKSFKGTLNGNGKTLTVSAPIFKDFSGTVRDLTIEGKIAVSSDAGALSVTAGNCTIWNVTNKASVKIGSKALNAGGLIAAGIKDAQIVIGYCKNYGEITSAVKASGSAAGGFIGRADSFYFYESENLANVNSTSAQSMCGGFVGKGVFSSAYNEVGLFRCVNKGSITGMDAAAGFVGHIGCSGNSALEGYRFYCCENFGDVSGALYAGGLVGYGYGSGTVEYLRIERSVNTGTITGGQKGGGFAGQFVGYCNTIGNFIQDNIGVGKLKAHPDTDAYLVFFGVSSATSLISENICRNYIIENDGQQWFSYALADSNASRRQDAQKGVENGMYTYIKAEDVASGALCMLINRYAGANVFNQTLGEDAVPTNREGAKYVVYDMTKEEDAFVNGDVPRLELPENEPEIPVDSEGLLEFLKLQAQKAAEETTVAETSEITGPSEETTQAQAEKKGCGSSLSALALLPVLLCGMAVKFKK